MVFLARGPHFQPGAALSTRLVTSSSATTRLFRSTARATPMSCFSPGEMSPGFSVEEKEKETSSGGAVVVQEFGARVVHFSSSERFLPC